MLRTLKSDTLNGKTVLIRYDLNVSFNGDNIVDDSRLKETARSILTIISKSLVPPKLVLIAHLGRPKGFPSPKLSLQKILPHLSNLIDKPINFLANPLQDSTVEVIVSSPPGSIFMIENLRFWLEEETNNNTFAMQLARLGEIYVNDAFSVSHRSHVSTCGLTNYLPSYAGPNLIKEITILEQHLNNPKNPSLAIIGGAKISTKIGIIEHLIPKLDYLIIGGAMANTFLFARGNSIGKSLFESNTIDLVESVTALANKYKCQIYLPHDVVIAKTIKSKTTILIVKINQVPNDYMILDIGPQSVKKFCDAINQSQTILWNGPIGAFEYPPFDVATNKIATKIAQHTQEKCCVSIAGGGDTLAALRRTQNDHLFSYTSSAGGAFLEWLQGDILPGINVLKK